LHSGPPGRLGLAWWLAAGLAAAWLGWPVAWWAWLGLAGLHARARWLLAAWLAGCLAGHVARLAGCLGWLVAWMLAACLVGLAFGWLAACLLLLGCLCGRQLLGGWLGFCLPILSPMDS